MKKIAIPFVALGLLVNPTLMGTSVIGASAQAEEIRIGVPDVRVEDRDHDRDHRWRRDHDRDDVVVIKKHRDRDHDRDND